MLKRLLVLDGVQVVCQFRDDGAFIAGHGLLEQAMMSRLAKFAHDYKRLIQGNADQLSMFTGRRGWTPPRGWIVRGPETSVCSVGNLVCLVDNHEGSLNTIMVALGEAAHR